MYKLSEYFHGWKHFQHFEIVNCKFHEGLKEEGLTVTGYMSGLFARQGNNATMWWVSVAWLDSRVDGLSFIGWRLACREESGGGEHKEEEREGGRAELFFCQAQLRERRRVRRVRLPRSAAAIVNCPSLATFWRT